MLKHFDEINYETSPRKVSKLKKISNLLEEQKEMNIEKPSIYFEKLDPLKYKHNNDLLREMYNLFIEII